MFCCWFPFEFGATKSRALFQHRLIMRGTTVIHVKEDQALKRIKDGTFGYCAETGEPIGIKRLIARPVAELCIAAQEKHEKEEKVYADD